MKCLQIDIQGRLEKRLPTERHVRGFKKSNDISEFNPVVTFRDLAEFAKTISVFGIAKYEFRADGILRAITELDPNICRTETISEVKVMRRVAGTAETTIIDINKNGTSIFTNPVNRPSIDFSDGDNFVVFSVPDVTSLLENDILTLDIDSVEDGNPQDLQVLIY